jgi:tetratricopeptide (TPR) repeat protein
MIDSIESAKQARDYFLNGNLTNALSLYYQILSTDLGNSINYYNVAITYEALEEYELAVSYYKKSIRIDNYIRSVNNLAEIYIEVIKDYDIAKEYLDFAIKSKPNDAEAYNLYARICFINKDYEMAEKYLNKSIFLDKNYFKNYYDLALVYYTINNKEKALKNIKHSIKLNDKFTPAKELCEQIKKMS